MANDIQMQRAKLADKKRQLQELNLRAEAHVIELRNILDPYIEDYSTLKMSLGNAEWDALQRVHVEMCRLKDQIAKMERDLNG